MGLFAGVVVGSGEEQDFGEGSFSAMMVKRGTCREFTANKE